MAVLHHSTPNQATTLTDLTQYRASDSSNTIAYTFLKDGESPVASLTFEQLDQKAKAVGAWLQAQNAEGQRALLLYPSSLDYIVAFLGCLYAGVVAVPAYPPHPKRPITRINAIIEDAKATFALTTKTVKDGLEARFVSEPHLRSLAWLATDTVDDSLGAAWIRPNLTADTLAFLQYTSGSTSTPKGVMITHGNLLYTLEDLHRAWAHTAESVMVTWLPIFHDLGLIYGILTPLYCGFQCYLMSPLAFLQKPYRWLKAIDQYGGTHTAAPNFAYELCLRKINSAETETLNLSSLQVALNAAEPVRFETVQRFSQKFEPAGFRSNVFCSGYGLAEASVKVSAEKINTDPIFYAVNPEQLENHNIVPDENGLMIAGCGESAIGATICIVDAETHELCSADTVGEIWVNSGSVAQGYWNRPDTSRDTFHATIAGDDSTRFMRTGDLGFLVNNQLFITGRHKDLLIIRGRNLYPHDIEHTVEQAHPAMRPGRGAAFSVTVDNEERLIVVQEPRPKLLASIDPDMLLTVLRRAIVLVHDIQPYKILLLKPGGVLKTSNGKIQRQGCRQAYLDDQLPVLASWCNMWRDSAENATSPTLDSPPSHPELVNWITLWLANHLAVDPTSIDPDTPFADYGLESVTAVELIALLNKWLVQGVEVDATAAWDYPTINLLSEHFVVMSQSQTQIETQAIIESDIIEENMPDETDLLAMIEQEIAASLHLLN